MDMQRLNEINDARNRQAHGRVCRFCFCLCEKSSQTLLHSYCARGFPVL